MFLSKVHHQQQNLLHPKLFLSSGTAALGSQPTEQVAFTVPLGHSELHVITHTPVFMGFFTLTCLFN